MTLARYAASVLIALGSAYAFFIGGAPAGTGLAQLRLISLVIIALALAAWAIAAWRDPSWRPRSVFLPAILASIAAMALATATSHSPRVSAEYLIFAVLLAALYLLLVRLMASPRLRERILVVAAGSGVFITLAFLAAIALLWVQFWSLVGRPILPPLRPGAESLLFTTPNLVAPMIVLLGSVLFGLVSGTSGRARALRVGAFFAIAAAVLLTGSRGAWFGIVVGGLSLGVGALYAGGVRSAVAPVWDRVRRIGPVWLGLAAIAAIAVGVVLAPEILRRLDTSGGNRVAFWRIAVEQFVESPLTGAGPGMWGAERIRRTLVTESDEYIPTSHDLYLQTASELGLVGLAAGVFVVLTLLWLLRDGLRDADATRRRWALVGAFTAGYFGAHQVVDYFANIPGALLAFAIPFALLDATTDRRPQRLPSWSFTLGSRGARVVGGLAVAATLVLGIAIEAVALRHADAVALANEGRWAEANVIAAYVVATDPDMPAYWLTAGLTAAQVGDDESAATHLRNFAETTDLPQAWLDSAAAYARLGDVDRARYAVLRSVRLGRQQVAVNLAATDVALRIGYADFATHTAAWALQQAPSLADDPWWMGDEQRSETFRAGVTLATQDSGPATGWQLALYAGDLDAAARNAGSLPSGAREDALAVIAAWAGDPRAVAALKSSCLDRPYDPVLAWCARVAAKLGLPDAGRFRDLAMILQATSESLANLEIVTQPTTLAVAGSAAEIYAVHAYRRFTPWDLLSPDLPHLTEG